MNPVKGFRSDDIVPVDAQDWDPSDRAKSKVKPQRKFSFEHQSAKKQKETFQKQ